MLELSRTQPLAVGHLRYVFQHPENPAYLIKVMRADAVDARIAKGRWYKRLPRTREYIGYVRELKEYIASQARPHSRNAPIARMIGLVDTDLGLGLVAEKVVGPDGGLARTLAALYAEQRGFSAALDHELDAFYRGLIDANVIVGDMHAWNIVHGTDSRGGPRLILIDGFGEKNIIPMASMSRRYNARNTARLYKRMRAQAIALIPLDTPP
jgi:hypothetical protein